MDAYDSATLNYYDYSDTKKIKLAFKNWSRLAKAAESGNISALIVRMDIEKAFEQCTKRQREIITECLIHNQKEFTVAFMLGITQKVVSMHLKCGIKKISKLLTYKFVYIDEVL